MMVIRKSLLSRQNTAADAMFVKGPDTWQVWQREHDLNVGGLGQRKTPVDQQTPEATAKASGMTLTGYKHL